MMLSPFDPGHGPKVFLLPSFVGQTCVSSSLLQITMPQQLLQTLQAHPGIQQLRGAGMPKTMQRIAPLRNPGLLQITQKHHPGGRIAQGASPLTIKQQRLSWIPAPHPFLQRLTSIRTQINHSPRPILLPYNELNLPLLQLHIAHPRPQQLPNPHPGPQQDQDHRPISDFPNDRQQSLHILNVHRPGQGLGHLDPDPPGEHIGRHHSPFQSVPQKGVNLVQTSPDR